MTQPDDHTARMQRLKASVDRRIEAAQEEKGLLIVHTRGEGQDHGRARDGVACAPATGCKWRSCSSSGVPSTRPKSESPVIRRPRDVSADGRGVHLGNTGS